MINLSPFAAQHLVMTDPACEETLLVLVKATYDLKSGKPRVHDKQEPVRLADEYHGEPGKSSIKAAAEGALVKPAVDVLLLGSAYPNGKDKTQVDVRLRFGPLEKVVRVFGERVWEQGLIFLKPSSPQ